jgi:hypothetical protein
MTQSSQYHEIAAEARMMSVPPGVVDSLGFEDLGDIGPAPPDARLSYYVEYGPDPREPERRLFIASSASLPQLPKPAQPPKPYKPRKIKPRKTPLDSLLKQAAKAGKSVKGAEVYRDRTVLQFGEPMPAEPDNPWPLDEFRAKETKQ